MKIVIDTNILLAIISKTSNFRWIFDHIISGGFQLCVSTYILFEYKEILQRKTNHAISENVLNFISTNPYTQKVDIYFNFNLIQSDKSDNKFVDCAISANAVCIISNDNHFGGLKSIDFPRVKVLTLADFDKEYKNKNIS